MHALCHVSVYVCVLCVCVCVCFVYYGVLYSHSPPPPLFLAPVTMYHGVSVTDMSPLGSPFSAESFCFVCISAHQLASIPTRLSCVYMYVDRYTFLLFFFNAKGIAEFSSARGSASAHKTKNVAHLFAFFQSLAEHASKRIL